MLGGRAAVPESDGVWNGVRMGRPQASSRDSHGAFCRDRRVAERQQHLHGRRRGPDRARGEGGERAGGADRLVRRTWLCGDTDRAGGRPLSQWLHAGLTGAKFEAVLLETRHVKAALSAMVVKTDRRGARGIAQLLRMGWFRPVHRK